MAKETEQPKPEQQPPRQQICNLLCASQGWPTRYANAWLDAAGQQVQAALQALVGKENVGTAIARIIDEVADKAAKKPEPVAEKKD
jgi:hypothetical protein